MGNRYKGRLGMVRAPSALGDAAAVVLAQRTGAVYQVSDLTTRIARGLSDDAVAADFVVTDGAANTFNPTSIVKPVMEFNLDVTTYPTAPYQVTSSNSRVYTLANVGGFREFSLDLGGDVADATEFGMEWREPILTLRGWTARASGFWKDQDFVADADAGMVDLDDMPCVVTFFPQLDTAAGVYIRFVGLAEVVGAGVNVPIGELATKEIRIEGVGPLYTRIDT